MEDRAREAGLEEFGFGRGCEARVGERLGWRPQKEPEERGAAVRPPPRSPTRLSLRGSAKTEETPAPPPGLLPGRLGRRSDPGKLRKGWGRPESLQRDPGAQREEGGAPYLTPPRFQRLNSEMRFGSGSPGPYCWEKAWGTLEGKGGGSGWVSPRDPIA